MEKVYPRPEEFRGVGDPSSERRVNVVFKREAFDVIDRLSGLTGRSRSRIVSDLVTDCLPALQELLSLQTLADRYATAATSALKEFLDHRLQNLRADVEAAKRPLSNPAGAPTPSYANVTAEEHILRPTYAEAAAKEEIIEPRYSTGPTEDDILRPRYVDPIE